MSRIAVSGPADRRPSAADGAGRRAARPDTAAHGHDDFAFEPVRGLPEALPPGEAILWQGAPDWRRLAWEAFGLPWVIAWFGAIYLWRTLAGAQEGVWASAAESSFVLILGAVVVVLLALSALAQAKATVYTITNRRVAMRIGAALVLTLNLPFAKLASADFRPGRRGTGTIALSMNGHSPLGYLTCWPHVRPWRVARVQPALRCIPDAGTVAALLSETAEAAQSAPEVARTPVAVAAE